MIGIQVRAMRRIIQDENYLTWRLAALHRQLKTFRRMLGGLLNADTIRREAAIDLVGIVANAWDLSGRMFTSHFTFIFTYPKVGDRFIHPTMGCADPNVKETALQLHIRQAKIKLAVTPTIIIRNDRDM